MSAMNLLTEREKEVLTLICEGKQDSEIAKLLNVSIHTAKMHVRHLLAKYVARDRKQLMAALNKKNYSDE